MINRKSPEFVASATGLSCTVQPLNGCFAVVRSISDLLVGEGSFNATILVYRTFLIVTYFCSTLTGSGLILSRLNSRLLSDLRCSNLGGGEHTVPT